MAVLAFRTLVDPDDGKRMFAFFNGCDPFAVMRRAAWAFTEGKKVCDLIHCPADQGGYCLECHMFAAIARNAARAMLAARV